MFGGMGIGGWIGVTIATVAVAMRVICPWIYSDLKYINRVRIFLGVANRRIKNRTFVIDVFEEQAKKIPDKTFIFYNGKSYTYKFVNEQANRIARAFQDMGFKQGDTFAVMMYNEPAFIWTYLGLQKIGIQTAFINVNIKGRALLHCVNCVSPVALVVGEDAELQLVLKELIPDMPGTQLFTLGHLGQLPQDGFQSLSNIMASMSSENVDGEVRAGIKITDPSIFIYTSGTTGLPKAAIVSHQRILIPCALFKCYGLTDKDNVYICLPLYHSSGLVLGVGNVLSTGSTMVLARKFSASKFWEDCRTYDVKAFLYIGELCRYLLARPEVSLDQSHGVRVAIGNGLRQDIYQKFKSRFNLAQIFEFYGATEGVVGFINMLNVTGSCGRSSPLMQKLLSCDFLKFNVDTEEPVRGEDGFCVPAQLGEPGLLVARITPSQTYDGYKGSNESKYLRDVFTVGDLYSNTGDLFTRDNNYNLFFNDRIGDTFRWKGENVSTTEVSNALCELDFIIDAIVYGVKVPGCDGRAGMACLHVSNDSHGLSDEQLHKFQDKCKDRLPGYARPMFLRVAKEASLTSTFKQNKVTLKREGWDQTVVADEVYVYDKESEKYRLLDNVMCEKIESMELKF